MIGVKKSKINRGLPVYPFTPSSGCAMIHSINWHDLEFERVPVEFHSTCGVPQTRWAKVGMPLIPQNVINGVFYLYRDRADALAGRDPKGTGFVVRFDGTYIDEVPGHHFYGVTNWHVACAGGFSTIRLNTKDGGTDIIELGPEDWYFLPGKYDVAVVPLSLDDKVHAVSSISTHEFANEPPENSRRYIGVGDDVFMIGLFVNHGGTTTNVPSARFGNISMLPNSKAKIEQPTGYWGESYVVDMHSRTGFSGSPVYVYRTFGADLSYPWGIPFRSFEMDLSPMDLGYIGDGIGGSSQLSGRSGHIKAETLFKFLGIHWGQFPERWELRDKNQLAKLKESRKDLITEGGYVEGMSGMTCVIPAWQIMEVFSMPALKDLRHPGIVAAKKANAAKPKPESVPVATDENPTAREDFNSLLGAAARKQPQGD